MGRKHCGKRRNCSLGAIYPFPTVFSKDLYCSVFKRLVSKGASKGVIVWEWLKLEQKASALRLAVEHHSSGGSVADLRTGGR